MASEFEVLHGGTTAASSTSSLSRKKYRASIYPKDEDVPTAFAELILELEKLLECKIWFIIQQSGDGWDEISNALYRGLAERKGDIEANERIGLLIHSSGGQVSSAYQIVRLFQRRTEEFSTIVPLYAKGAATLMALGGKKIIMGADAELGPLDVKIYDETRDEWGSAVDSVQSFERLNAYARSAFDQAMQLFTQRTGQKPMTLLPLALQYVTTMVGPLADKIDTLELTRQSRELKVAEDYAIRVMRPNYSEREYTKIARAMVEKYSSHEFIVDSAEAGAAGPLRLSAASPLNLGLHVSQPARAIEDIFTRLSPYLRRFTMVGRLTEIPL